jgi:hypothetical protein
MYGMPPESMSLGVQKLASLLPMPSGERLVEQLEEQEEDHADIDATKEDEAERE